MTEMEVFGCIIIGALASLLFGLGAHLNRIEKQLEDIKRELNHLAPR